MVTKEHLTQSCFEKMISIKAALNWGNSFWFVLKIKIVLLIKTFPNIKPIERPSYVTSEEPLNPEGVFQKLYN